MGWFSLGVTLAVCGIMTALIIIKPFFTLKLKKRTLRIETFWLVSLLAPIILLSARAVSFSEVLSGITAEGMNPLKILALFLSMCFLSVMLDKAGFFEYCAVKVLSRAGKSQTKLFLLFYALVSLLTVFTSNDIIILTFTPFVYYFAKNAGLNPLPYFVTVFIAANTWSLTLIIGNPTNIYIASSLGVDFMSYLKVMALPALACGLASLAFLLIVFRKEFKKPLPSAPAAAGIKLKDKPVAALSLSVLAACIIIMALSDYIGVEMWPVSLGAAALLLIAVLIINLVRKARDKNTVNSAPLPVTYASAKSALKGLPYTVIPFLLSMFIAVRALEMNGVSAQLGDALAGVAGGNNFAASFLFGALSALASNIINNIPMSVLFTSVLSSGGMAAAPAALCAAYASVIGSNIGAFLSPAGALAGILFLKILKEKESGFTPLTFIKYCAPAAAVSLAAACLTLVLTVNF